MAPGRARDEEKERQWRRRIDQWRVSGLSVRVFCARHGLATASFYNWRRVLQRRAAAEPLAFVPVQVVADVVPAQASALEVVLADGRAVRVAPGFDAATLRRLLAVLEGEASC
jgi:transposase